jgi:2-iminobutanoate/2-iminopropanoate deaminase
MLVMTFSHLVRALFVVTLMTAGGCENTPNRSGLPWWPQGPGNPDVSASEPSDQVDRSTAGEAAAQPTTQAAEARKQTTSTGSPASVAQNGESHATRYRDLLFLSGQTAADAGDITQQTHAVMQKIDAILTAHGLTMSNVVHATVQLASIKDLQAVASACSSHFPAAHPAWTVAEVAHLPGDALVQITVVAGR